MDPPLFFSAPPRIAGTGHLIRQLGHVLFQETLVPPKRWLGVYCKKRDHNRVGFDDLESGIDGNLMEKFHLNPNPIEFNGIYEIL